jgi:hypothetical protein
MRELETTDELAGRAHNIGRRLTEMPFGEYGSQQRAERDRLCDVYNELNARLHRRLFTED